MAEVVHTSRSTVRKHKGPHRSAVMQALEKPVDYGIHGGIKDFYGKKYGLEVDKEYPATLDHMIAATGG